MRKRNGLIFSPFDYFNELVTSKMKFVQILKAFSCRTSHCSTLGSVCRQNLYIARLAFTHWRLFWRIISINLIYEPESRFQAIHIDSMYRGYWTLRINYIVVIRQAIFGQKWTAILVDRLSFMYGQSMFASLHFLILKRAYQMQLSGHASLQQLSPFK